MWDRQKTPARKGVIWSTGASSSEIEDTMAEGALGQLFWHSVLKDIICHTLGWFLRDILASMLAVNIRGIYPQAGRVSVGFGDRVAGQSFRK